MIDLKKVIQILSNELEKLDNDSSISFEDDFYWNILDQELYNIYKGTGEFYDGKPF